MFNIKNLLNQAQVMQSKIADIQEELGSEFTEGLSGGGMVKVIANGKQEIKSIRIEPELLAANDLEMLEDLITAAANDALNQSKELAQTKMNSLTGGLNIPGLF